jgi:predicted nucleotidyltransferase
VATVPQPAGSNGALPRGRRAEIDLPALKVLLQRVEQQLRPEQVWLFGSRARGDHRADSDWDLLAVVPDDTPRGAFDPRVAWRLQRDAGVYADLALVTRAEFLDDLRTVNTLPYLVMAEGALIYERGGLTPSHGFGVEIRG